MNLPKLLIFASAPFRLHSLLIPRQEGSFSVVSDLPFFWQDQHPFLSAR